MKGHQLGVGSPHPFLMLPHPSHQGTGKQQSHRGAEQGQQGHHRVIPQDQDQAGRKLEQTDYQAGQQSKHAPRHGADVPGHPAEEIAGVECLEGAPIRLEKAAEHVGLHLILDLQIHLGGNAAVEGGEAQGHQPQQHIACRKGRHLSPGPMRTHHGGGEGAGEKTATQAQPRRQEPQSDIQRDLSPVAPGIAVNPAQLLAHFLQIALPQLVPYFFHPRQDTHPLSA